MDYSDTTVLSNTTHSKDDAAGYDYPQQPAPPTYYPDNSGQPPYYQPHHAPAGYYPTQNNVMNSNTVVVTQPARNYTQVVPVQDNMNLALFACLCCFWPVGLCAIWKANEARDAIARGDLQSARRNGSDARKYSLLSIAIGVVSSIIIIIVAVVITIKNIHAAEAAIKSNDYSYSYNG